MASSKPCTKAVSHNQRTYTTRCILRSNTWQPGTYPTVASAWSVATGFGGVGNAAEATIADASCVLNCAHGVLPSIPSPSQSASVTWSACVQPLPTNVHVFSAPGGGLADGSQVIVARAL